VIIHGNISTDTSNKVDTTLPSTCIGTIVGFVNNINLINVTTDILINSTSLYYINSGGFIGTVANNVAASSI